MPPVGYQTEVTGDKPRSKSKRRLPELASINAVAQRCWFSYLKDKEHKTFPNNDKGTVFTFIRCFPCIS